MAADNDNAPSAPGTAKCPSCGSPTVAEFRPFCSARCKDLDLSRWLRGVYAIPGGNTDEDEDGDRPVADIENLTNGRAGDGADE